MGQNNNWRTETIFIKAKETRCHVNLNGAHPCLSWFPLTTLSAFFFERIKFRMSEERLQNSERDPHIRLALENQYAPSWPQGGLAEKVGHTQHTRFSSLPLPHKNPLRAGVPASLPRPPSAGFTSPVAVAPSLTPRAQQASAAVVPPSAQEEVEEIRASQAG